MRGLRRNFLNDDRVRTRVNSTTLFVDNLPPDIRKIWVYNLFERFGKIADCYIPYKRSKISGNSFGFVRFAIKEDAFTAISKTNGFWFWNQKLVVNIARFQAKSDVLQGRVSNGHWVESKKDWNNGRSEHPKSNKEIWKQKERSNLLNNKRNGAQIGTSFLDANDKGQYKANSRISIKAKQMGNEWLYRSIIAILSPYRSIIYVQDHLKNLGFIDIEVKPMGGDKVILTFKSIEDRDSLLNGGKFSWLKECFKKVQKWEENVSSSNSRLVWLNCYGVLLHLWNLDTFSRLGSLWGDIITISDDTTKGLSFAVGKVLISTECMEIINQVVDVENKYKSFQVRIVEEQMVVNTFLRADCNCPGCNAKISIDQAQLKECEVSKRAAHNLERVENECNVGKIQLSSAGACKLDEEAISKEEYVSSPVEERLQIEKVVEKVIVKTVRCDTGNMGPLQKVTMSTHNIDDRPAISDSISSSSDIEASIVGNGIYTDTLNVDGPNQNSLGVENSIMGKQLVLDSFGGLSSDTQPLNFSPNCLEVQEKCSSNGLNIEGSLLHAVSRKDEAEFTYEELDNNDNVINEEDHSQVDVNHVPIQAAIKGIKGKNKRKGINDILGYSKVEKGGNIKGRRNKNKCVVLRFAVASAALSASLSSEGINNRNRILLDETKAIWEVDKLFGIRYDGDEEEVVSKIAEMEALNKSRADCQH